MKKKFIRNQNYPNDKKIWIDLLKILDRKNKLFSKNLRFFITKELKIFCRNSRKKRKKEKSRKKKKRKEYKRKEKKRKGKKKEEKRGRRKYKIKIEDIYIRTYVPSELVGSKRNIITDFS